MIPSAIVSSLIRVNPCPSVANCFLSASFLSFGLVRYGPRMDTDSHGSKSELTTGGNRGRLRATVWIFITAELKGPPGWLYFDSERPYPVPQASPASAAEVPGRRTSDPHIHA